MSIFGSLPVEFTKEQGLNSCDFDLYKQAIQIILIGKTCPVFLDFERLMTQCETSKIVMQDDNESNGGDNSVGGDNGTDVITKVKPKVKKPSLYRVLLLNDDFTPMEFVVDVLARFFSMNIEQATKVMLHVHQNGVGECGVYTYEVAETKVTQVMDYARKNQHPLQCVMEKK